MMEENWPMSGSARSKGLISFLDAHWLLTTLNLACLFPIDFQYPKLSSTKPLIAELQTH